MDVGSNFTLEHVFNRLGIITSTDSSLLLLIQKYEAIYTCRKFISRPRKWVTYGLLKVWVLFG